MANKTITEYLENVVSEIIKSESEDNYKIEVEGSSNIGDGYMGEMIFFKIISNTTGIVHNLLLKLAARNDTVRKITMMELNFEREIFMYSVIFPAIEKFISGRNQNLSILEFTPKYYWHSILSKREALVLENLKSQGYSMWKKHQALDFDHTMLVVRTLAKWHGLVMAYRDSNPAQFQLWSTKLPNIRYELLSRLGLIEHARINFNRVLNILHEKGKLELESKYRKFEDNIDQFFLPASDENDRIVITHADCWINNVMFKYENSKTTPEKCKLFDFQVCHLNTPIEDLSFFIYGSCDASVLSKFDLLLKEYYATLTSTIQNLGSNPENLFNFSEFEEHWKKYGICGVLSSIEIIKLQLFTDEEVPQFTNFENGECDMAKHFDIKMKYGDLYFQRLVDVFTHFGNKYL